MNGLNVQKLMKGGEQLKITIEVENCDDCPHAVVSKVWTADPYENVRKIKCKVLDKFVHGGLDWNEKSPVPLICPFNEIEKP